MTYKEKIIAEIKRRLKDVEQGFSDGEAEHGYQTALDDVLSIISSIQEEPKFKVGQTIWKDDVVAKVLEISEDGYHCDNAFIPYAAEEQWHEKREISQDDIRNIIEQFIAWNGETEVIDVANLDSAVYYISECMNNSDSEPKPFLDGMVDAAESLGISNEEYEKIVDECIYGKEPEMVDVDDLPVDDSVNDGLEAEIKRYVYDPYFDLNGVAIKGATSYLTVEDVAEIARHFAEFGKKHAQSMNNEYLEEQSSDLDEFIKKRVSEVPVVMRSGFHQLCRTLIKDGAEWGKKHAQSMDIAQDDLDAAAQDYVKSMSVGSPYIKTNAFKAGANWKEQKILKDATEGSVYTYHGIKQAVFSRMSGMLERLGVKDGDVVKISIFKA